MILWLLFSVFVLCLAVWVLPWLLGKRTLPSDLTGYHVLITGGSSGIGLALARQFHSAGASLTLVARDLQRLQEARHSITESTSGKGHIHLLSVDVSASFVSLQSKFDMHIRENGAVDILVHCAGYAFSRTFLDTPPATAEQLIKTNYLSAVNLTSILLPHMLADKATSTLDRRIVFVCSMAAQVGVYGLAAYTGSKFALRGFAEALNTELEHSGPLVTIAFPPDTDTPGFKNENIGKPAATLEISSGGGLASADHVAQRIFKDTLSGKLVSSFGLEGHALSMASAALKAPINVCGGANASLLVTALYSLVEVLLAGPLRLVGIGYALWMRRVVGKHSKRHQD